MGASPHIQLQFSRQADIASDAIAWFSQGALSHVDAIIKNGYALLGARSDTSNWCKPPNPWAWIKPGVRERPPGYAKFALRVVFTIPCTAEQLSRWNTFLRLQIGKPYDKEAIWGFVFDRNWREQDSWICSELQAAALEHAGIVPPLYLAANKITPVALALAVSALPGVTHVTYKDGV